MALDQWRKETKDLGLTPENELKERMRPSGVWTKVAQPVISESRSGEAISLQFNCPSEGASIAYTTEEGRNARWLLYTREITVKRPVTIRVKGCRLGFLDSDEVIKRYE
jgi:hypothetical protein